MENGSSSNYGISAILFDLDNTLIATRKADKLACNKLAQILWEKWSIPTDVASLICKSYLKSFRKCPENVSMNLDKWRHLLWVQSLGEQYNKLADEVYHIWLQLRYDYLAVTPEIQSLLLKLRQHYFVGLITNGTSRAQWEKIERLQLRKFFDIILVSGDLPWEKPHHKIFHEACRYLGVLPEQCLMVGDKLETDIMGGLSANLGGTVWVPLNGDAVLMERNMYHPSPDYVIGSVTELPNLLPKNPKVLNVRKHNNNHRFSETFRTNNKRMISLPDLDDSNSNSSDGS